jgi:uncharacterized protein YukE
MKKPKAKPFKRRTVENRISVLVGQIEAEDDRHEKRIDKIDREIASLRSRCSHRQRTWHGDPSGGNDSYYRCDICGKEM